jgi:hypothetical protein
LGAQGNAKLCVDASGRLHAVWEESLPENPTLETRQSAGQGSHQHSPAAGSGRVIMHACSNLADGQFKAPQPILARPGRFQTRPAIACGTGGLIVVAWNELDENGKRVVVTRLEQQDLD